MESIGHLWCAWIFTTVAYTDMDLLLRGMDSVSGSEKNLWPFVPAFFILPAKVAPLNFYIGGKQKTNIHLESVQWEQNEGGMVTWHEAIHMNRHIHLYPDKP